LHPGSSQANVGAQPGQFAGIKRLFNHNSQERVPAVASQARNPALRAAPTVIDLGIKGFQMAGFTPFWRRPAFQKTWRTKLNDAFGPVMAPPDNRRRRVAPGADPAFVGRGEFAQFLASEPQHGEPAWKAYGSMLD
jgi:tripartite-type tricarboxylate transporter receptor subunit TctC